MNDATDDAYGASPERLYLIDIDGRVRFKGGAGPFFFEVDPWEQEIATVGTHSYSADRSLDLGGSDH